MTALYACRVTHVRTAPLRNAFTYPVYLWLVDVDRPPRGFLARDHFGGGTLRQGVTDFLRERGVEAVGRIRMLAQPRVLGHVFNPLSLYWCEAPGGTHVVAEVHNTYGERHGYLLRPGQDRLDKEFFVSPFYPVDGTYRMSLPEPGERLAVSVTLHRPGDRPFVATVRGERTRGRAVRRALATLAVPVRIRRQGIGLYLRGLPRKEHPG
ncbi:DUF1365 domain-containing protein [Actinomadura sp. DC4]|uniref:DUF1365 domain-containing protein n=1 Tax=Actinomadura sp. DC4 TaxID=3055069 RepID=UPI0025B100F9|nr:DUF1365 domain-containing protein [Actinomadura sp. DC4]MDN3351622.1 DUF1365 domain-containing protein [Actinomadura sp. DC4]